MLIIWQKFGFLIAVIGFGSLVLSQIITDALLGPNTYEDNPALYAGLAMLVAAAVTYGLSLFLSKREQPRELIDPKNNQKVIVHRHSTFFFVPVLDWSYVFAVIGVVSLAISFLGK